MADLSKWEQVLRNNGYTDQDLIKIADSIIDTYEYGLHQRLGKKVLKVFLGGLLIGFCLGMVVLVLFT